MVKRPLIVLKFKLAIFCHIIKSYFIQEPTFQVHSFSFAKKQNMNPNSLLKNVYIIGVIRQFSSYNKRSHHGGKMGNNLNVKNKVIVKARSLIISLLQNRGGGGGGSTESGRGLKFCNATFKTRR